MGKAKHHLYMTQETAQKKVAEFGGSVSKTAKELGIPRTTLRRWLQGDLKKSSIRRFVVTYAQNNTDVHKGFYNALMGYCREWKAELICYRGRYRNPTDPSMAYTQGYEYWWDSKVRPFLMDSHRELNDKLCIYPARTQPTAVNPLSGYDTHTGSKSGIFPHPKVRLKTVPTPSQQSAKILATTGAITVRNYSKSKAGEKGQFHHIIGAVVVEIADDENFYIRHINAEKDGSFYDIAGGRCVKYNPNGTTERDTIDVYTKGDLHYPFVHHESMKATLTLLDQLRPEILYLHDPIDFWPQNHHSRNDRFQKAAKELSGKSGVEDDVSGFCKFVSGVSSSKYETCVVPSNHSDAMDKWLQQEDLDKLGGNAAYFHWLSYHKHRSANWTPNGFKFFNTLEFAVSERLDIKKHNIRFLERDVPEIRLGIDYSMHGDIGPNGAKGSASNLSKIGVKSVIGHAHSPSIVDGCYQVGVGCIHLSYAKGASGWKLTDCITYKNGKRTLIHYSKGKYHL